MISPLAHHTNACQRMLVWSVVLAKYTLIVNPDVVGTVVVATTPLYVAIAKGRLLICPDKGYVIDAEVLEGVRLPTVPPWVQDENDADPDERSGSFTENRQKWKHGHDAERRNLQQN